MPCALDASLHKKCVQINAMIEWMGVGSEMEEEKIHRGVWKRVQATSVHFNIRIYTISDLWSTSDTP